MAYHTATLVDHELWVIGGNNGRSTIYEAVHVLDTKTLQWRTIRVRCAACTVHLSSGNLKRNHPSLEHLCGSSTTSQMQWKHEDAAALCAHVCPSPHPQAGVAHIWWLW